MTILLSVIGWYLLTGIVALLILELTTHRITRKIDTATLDAQNKLVSTGTALNFKTARVALMLAIFIFWPAMFIGMATKNSKLVIESRITKKYNSFLDYDLTRLLPRFIRRRIKKNG
jgi:hypothetical protein